MDFVVEEISSMISRGYEGDLRFSRQNVIIRHKQEGGKMRRIPKFPLGARVVRGPGFEKSASGEVGTIVGQLNTTHYWVRWDDNSSKRVPFRAIWLRWAEKS